MEDHNNIINSPLEDVLHNSMIPYAEYVILDRALPRVEDGLKPVQRRILYSMYDLGILPDKGYKKSARVVGDCLAKYHPHGDSSVYDAMVRLAQPFNMRMTLVDGHGNFGSVDGDSAAAMRYTEVKLQPLALELIDGLDKDTVNWSLNFDDSLKEPDTLPARFPNLLVNGATGIAVGLATNIPTHNLAEVIDGVVAYIDNPKIKLDEMMKIVKGPDFPTGGYIIAGDELRTAYETGKGKIQLRARINVEDAENGKKNIVITEIPYQVNKAQLLRKIAELQENDKDALGGIASIADESDRTGMRAVIKLKRDVDPNPIIKYLLKYTQLQCSFGINMVAIAGGKPRLMGLIDIISYYVDYQISIVLRRTKYDLARAKERAHILEGLIIAVTNIDKVIKIIKTSPDTPTAKQNLREAFDLSDKQAQAILDLRLARLTRLEVDNLKEELAQLKKLIAELQAIVDSKKLQKDIVKKEILVIKKKYRDERKSEIVSAEDDISFIAKVESKKTENYVIGVNYNGLVRKVKQTSYKRSAANVNPKKSEFMRFCTDATDEHLIYTFTNKGNCYRIDAEKIPEASGSGGGVKFETLDKQILQKEYPVAMFAVKNLEVPSGRLYFFTKRGVVKLTPWSEYAVAKSSFAAMKLKDGDELLSVQSEIPDANFVFATKFGMGLHCEDKFSEYKRMSGGIQGVDLYDGDEVISVTQIDKEKEYELVIATQFGTFKRVYLSLVNKLPRNRKGVKIADVGEDELMFAVPVVRGEKIYLMIEDVDGNLLYTDSTQTALESRTTAGKPVAALGMFRAKGVCSFRLNAK